MAPSASDGPLSKTVMVAIPDVPGVMAGVVTVVCRSAEPISVATVEGPLLLIGARSETFADVTVARPFRNGSVGGADDGTDSTMSRVIWPPTGMGPATSQEIGPAGTAPVQLGRGPTRLTPGGGL